MNGYQISIHTVNTIGQVPYFFILGAKLFNFILQFIQAIMLYQLNGNASFMQLAYGILYAGMHLKIKYNCIFIAHNNRYGRTMSQCSSRSYNYWSIENIPEHTFQFFI